MASIITRSTTAMVATGRKRLQRDQVIDEADTMFAFDFTLPYVNSNPAGLITNGATFTNLVDGAPPAVAVIQGATNITQLADNGGLSFPSGGENADSFINVGTSYKDFGIGDDDYLAIIWDNQDSSDFNATSAKPFFWKSTGNANVSNIWLDNGTGGTQIRGRIGTGASNGGASVTTTGRDAPRQIAFERVGAEQRLYINGVVVATSSVSSALQDASGAAIKIACHHKALLYRAALFDLSAPGARAGAKIVATDFAAKPFSLR